MNRRQKTENLIRELEKESHPILVNLHSAIYRAVSTFAYEGGRVKLTYRLLQNKNGRVWIDYDGLLPDILDIGDINLYNGFENPQILTAFNVANKDLIIVVYMHGYALALVDVISL